MMEIIKKGNLPEPQILNFRCDNCHTEFKTDEWLFMHEPRTVGKPASGNGYVHATCPLCKHFLSIKVHGS